MYSKILLATDLSASSELLVKCVINLVTLGLREVVLVHVVSLRNAGDLSKRVQAHDKELIEKQKKRLEKKGIRVKVEVPIGFPSYEINEIAEKEDVSLIMIGSHSRSLIRDIILGSEGEQIIRDAKKPVLIMKFNVKEGRIAGVFCKNIFKTILYPTDFSDDAERVLPYIKKAFDAQCERIILLHVQEEQRIKPYFENRLKEFNRLDQARLERIKNELVGAGAVNVKTIVQTGKTIPLILKISEEEKCTLIALGARGRTLLGEIFIGSTANNVARHAKMSVLFIN
ncbi:MAG: universal stress protein [bacterium]